MKYDNGNGDLMLNFFGENSPCLKDIKWQNRDCGTHTIDLRNAFAMELLLLQSSQKYEFEGG